MTDEETRFRQFLRGSGLKCTPERTLVLEEVFSNHEHFEAEDVVSGLRSRGHRVSRASVYRTLPLLVNSGLLKEVRSNEKHAHYEHTLGHEHHDHLICTKCGSTIEFRDSRIEELQDLICARTGFAPVSHELRIIGICSACNREEGQNDTR